MPYFLGVTGGIGSGKSTVSAILGELGWFVIDFDRLALSALDRRDVVEKLVFEFGDSILSEGGDLDRRKLALVAFENERNILKLQGIIHPIVEEEAFSEAEASGNQFIVFDAPLLIETGFWRRVDWVLVVVAPAHERVKRASERLGITEDEVKRRMRFQMSDEERLRYADFVVENNGSLFDLRRKVVEIDKKIKKLI